ncbi:MAG: VCBS repeat-containing protein, partial [Bacteroidetes bacterium]|nr:VCBS repeat-containing protein [Bacteroidota bacterium]
MNTFYSLRFFRSPYNFIFLFLLLLNALNLAAQPVIRSFSPVSGPVGTTVIITGSGFGTTTGKNIVYFGGMRAVVTNASTGSLTVTVPAAASYQPITVTVDSLTASSRGAFDVTFNAHGDTLDAHSFNMEQDFPAGYNAAPELVADLDGDGKPDIATAVPYTGYFSVYRNTSAKGAVSFAPKIDYTTASNSSSIAAGDLDGDGKQDIVVANSLDFSISIFRNASVPGNMLFTQRADTPKIYPNGQPWSVRIADFDGDGKPDLVVACYDVHAIQVFRNTSHGDSISFAADFFYQITELPLESGSESLSIADIDGDGKIDVAAIEDGTAVITVFRNTSTPGNMGFSAGADYACPATVSRIFLGDIDGDGRPDMVVPCGSTFSVFPNTSTSGTITFGTRQDYAPASGAYMADLGDMDGDGKPDLLITGGGSVTVCKNLSTTGNIALAPGFNYTAGVAPAFALASDMDGDSKADIVVPSPNGYNGSMSVLRNRITAPFVNSMTPNYGREGNKIDINGQHFMGTALVSLGGTPVDSFTVNSDTSITATVGPGSNGALMIVANGDTITYGNFIYTGTTIAGFSPVIAGQGDTVTISGAGFGALPSVSFGGVPATGY